MGDLFAFLLGAAVTLIAAGVAAFTRGRPSPEPAEVETLSRLEAELGAKTSEEIEAIHKELTGEAPETALAARLNDL